MYALNDEAVLSAGPIPDPVSRYHGPFDFSSATPADVERLAGPDRDDAHFDAGVLLEHGKQMGEQPGLLGRRRRRDDDELLLRGRERYAGRDKGRGNDCTSERAAIHRRSASI